MTQKDIDILFQLTITIHENEWFGKRMKSRSREEVQEWVAKRLAENLEVYTIPCGASWGVLVSKEDFDEYWSKNSKNMY
ncbi:MAG TPA: hypothetical protein VK172_10345 [Lentimicrobium sp.]|nr:hypothetical protein [Lentimicrobium sp.]